jgi:hypothetical protein
MSAEAIITVSAAVVALVQVIKWALGRDGWGPAIVLLVSLLGVAVWAVSQGEAAWASAWSYFAGWVAVTTSAAGVYGFTRAGVARLSREPTDAAAPE